MMASPENKPVKFADPLDRARQISLALSEAARFARFSTKSRAAYSGGGFQARRGAALMRFFVVGSFICGVLLPSLSVAVYFGFIASDEYVSESKFSVIGNTIPQLDTISKMTGLIGAEVVQDTQIITNYIDSRKAIEDIEKNIDLNKVYSNSKIDFLSRFDSKKPVEKFLRYWETMVTSSITMPSGIVILRVKAFTPQDSVDIANAVIRVSEALVNEMNSRINQDAIEISQRELERATARLTHARLQLEKVRNEKGILDASKAGDALNGLLTEARSTLITMQGEYAARSKQLSTNSPQMRVLKDRIDGISAQITEIQAQLTQSPNNTGGSQTSGSTIAASMSKFSELELERQIAERLYAGAVSEVEVARLMSEQKQIYLNAFVEPSLPQQAEYPKRLLTSGLVALGLFACWAACLGLITVIRNHIA